MGLGGRGRAGVRKCAGAAGDAGFPAAGDTGVLGVLVAEGTKLILCALLTAGHPSGRRKVQTAQDSDAGVETVLNVL